ncbi:LuxR C-terminal-related transcriptional regulator [Arthrobacter bambusae]|uniref:LuxR C-terminal-related transcriptional regulator n=1 Tax=Arthrobacter bambusae TaxID=1338426 RepID=UPI0027819018|nr:LuxR C-terminal-related transcriptional regulator [Arthrobacter bambusae]MDQ0030075.1 DNA-binding CsgD family transcriptional regulator [Arthrobacter bambusae]MDQ0097406.1 DNA-binding CsgD family transcriptional regulator [Arthrobacter bambusae]
MFEEEARRALDHVARGISVRIVGGAGSGRSTVLGSIVAHLEKTGAEVFGLSGSRLLQDTPFAGIGALGFDARARQNGPRGVADALAERLARRGAKAIVVDDVDLLDKESLAVIDIVHQRSRRPLVTTAGDSPLYSRSSVFSPARWPEAKIRLSPLRYGQVNKLLAQTLGSPPDVDLTTAVLMKSAGNPRLVVRIAQSAIFSKLLVLREGQWSIAGHTLWNEYLHSTIEALLQDLNADELTALHTMSVLGPSPVESLLPMVGQENLDGLERRRLLTVTEDVNNTIWVDVSPPIVADYFRDRHTLSSHRLLTDRIARAIDTPFQPPNDPLSAPLAELIKDLRNEAGSGTAATRHFQEQLRLLEEAHFGLWESEPTMSNAAAFLKFYWGGAIDPSRIEKVFSETQLAGAGSADRFFFAMTQALWAISAGDGLLEATSLLKDLGDAHPDWKAEAEAFAIYLAASFDRMPANLDQVLYGLTSQHSESGVVPVIQCVLELYRFNTQAAFSALDSADGYELAVSVEPFARGLALLIAGRCDEALTFSLAQRAAAQRGLDQFRFVASSYVAVLALLQRGLSLEADYVMTSVFALGRHGFLVSFLHDAMLRIAGLRALSSSAANIPSLGTQARQEVADIGPLPGTGKAVYELASTQYADFEEFDERAADLLKQQLDRGYITEAIYSALFMLSLFPGQRILEVARRLFKGKCGSLHDQLLAIASAISDEDSELLTILLDRYEPDADLHLIGTLLNGTAKRYSLELDPDCAAAFQQVVSAFNVRFQPRGEDMVLDTGGDRPQPLSAREIEIAILAGHHSNIEIGSRLGISTRTVENHISRALKKTGTSSRIGLYEVVRSLRK